MRQAGIIAAGALHALEHHVARLAEDHRNAKLLAKAVEETPGLSLESGPVETNLVWIDVDPTLGTARRSPTVSRPMASWSVRLGAQVIRACTHLDVSEAAVRRAADLLRKLGQA